MAAVIQFFSGFEGGSHANGYVEGMRFRGGTASLVTSPVYAGTYAFRCNPTGANIGYGLVSCPAGDGELDGSFGVAEVYGCFRFRVGTLPGSGYEHLLRVFNNGTQGMRICVDSNGYLHLRDGSENLLGTSPTQITTGQWYLLEFKQVESDDSYELKVDGISKVSGTISPGWPAGMVTDIYVGKATNISSQDVDFYYDDLVLCTGDYILQPYSINALPPNGDGYYTDWSGDWSSVDDIPPDGDTSYQHPTLVGNKATVVRNAPTSPGIIAAVMASFCCRYSYGGDSVKTLLRSNSTDKKATIARLLNSTYNLNLCQLEPTDFGRSDVPWTNVTAGLLEFGLEHTAGLSGDESRWTSCTLSVLYASAVERGTKVFYDLGG